MFFKAINKSVNDMDKSEEKEWWRRDLLKKIFSRAHKKRWVMLMTNLWVFFKQKQPSIIGNQHEPAMCRDVEKARKKKSKDRIIRDIKKR